MCNDNTFHVSNDGFEKYCDRMYDQNKSNNFQINCQFLYIPFSVLDKMAILHKYYEHCLNF